jgi:hypothetical protein
LYWKILDNSYYKTQISANEALPQLFSKKKVNVKETFK